MTILIDLSKLLIFEKYYNIIAYLFVIYLIIFNSFREIEMVIVLIEIILIFFTKNFSLINVIFASKST